MGAGRTMASPDFDRSVNPITNRGGGADYVQQINTAPSPGFSDLPTVQEIRRMYGGRSVEMGHLHYSCNEILQVHVRT